MNPETMHKQDRILSRLLDAQRSMRERDFEKRRKAESRNEHVPAESRRRSTSRRWKGATACSAISCGRSRKDMRRDYEDLIRKYFEALQQ